jgi:hypothetical protein
MRYFVDVYAIYERYPWSMTASAYAGIQKISPFANIEYPHWWQCNTSVAYHVDKETFISGRIEYFNDPHQVMITTLNNKGFNVGSASICFSKTIDKQVIFRIEDRLYYSEAENFKNEYGQFHSISNLIITSLTAWF